MSSSDAQFTVAAEKLKRAAPKEFDEFLAAFKSIASQAQTTLLSAPLADLQGAQGQAQMAARLLKLLRNCSERADQLQRRTT